MDALTLHLLWGWKKDSWLTSVVDSSFPVWLHSSALKTCKNKVAYTLYAWFNPSNVYTDFCNNNNYLIISPSKDLRAGSNSMAKGQRYGYAIVTRRHNSSQSFVCWLRFRVIHYLLVILLHFFILSICHCSWVVMKHHCSALRLFVSDLFITHPFYLLPPIPHLVILQFIKTWLHKNSSSSTSAGPSPWHENLCELLNHSWSEVFSVGLF